MIRSFALRRGLLDAATGDRKIHVGRIPRLGGVAIICAFYVSLAAVLGSNSTVGAFFKGDWRHSMSMLAGGLVIAGLGIYDDVRGADAKTKFAVQFAVAGGLYLIGFRIDHVATPFGSFWLGSLSLPITLLWIVGVTNAVNLIDGLDGLAGGVALIALATVCAISLIRPEPFMILVSAALAGSVFGFLFYNFNPASIFMGDSGSMFLGFMVATSSIRASQKASTAVTILIPIILLAIPIADTTLAVVRRALRRQGLFTGDREHLHHQLVASGLSHRQTVLALYVLSLTCALAALTLFIAQSHVAVFAVCIVLSLNACLLLSRLRPIRNADASPPRRRAPTPIARLVFDDGAKRSVAVSDLNDPEFPATLEAASRPASYRRQG